MNTDTRKGEKIVKLPPTRRNASKLTKREIIYRLVKKQKNISILKLSSANKICKFQNFHTVINTQNGQKIIQQISNYLKESFTKHGFVQKEDSFEGASLKNRTKRI